MADPSDAIASYERFLELAREQPVHPILVEDAQEWLEKLKTEGAP